MEEVEEIGQLETAPIEPTDRQELPAEEMEAKVNDMTESLARPDPTEATKVVTTLGAMSDAQRKEAIGQMSDEEFDAMMENLPPGEHERLSALVGATDDPKRKLRMWGASEKAELSRDERNLKSVPTSEEMPGEAQVIDRAVRAASDGKDEVDNEVEVTMKALEEPNLTPEAQKSLVEDMMKRKEKERAIEKQFGVNLTNDKGGQTEEGKPTPRATWSERELDQMAVVLDRLPADAIEENPDLVEIRRAQKEFKYNDKTETWEERGVVGTTKDGRIRVYDATMSDTQDHAGDSSEIAGIHRMTAFQQTLAHEVGHVVDRGQGHENADAVRAHADWKDEKRTPEIEAKLKQCENGGVASDGRMYAKNEDGSISSVDPALMPDGGSHTEGRMDGDANTWDYARSKKSDYFAEMYSKAVVAPELLYKDMVEGPKAHVEELKAKTPPASTEEIKEAERVAKEMAEQHAEMRAKVFHIDPETDTANETALEARADELGLDADGKKELMDNYKRQAAQAMTQEQLDAVYQTYDNERIYEY